jgi:DNA-binding PadR family transcriptional regulator
LNPRKDKDDTLFMFDIDLEYEGGVSESEVQEVPSQEISKTDSFKSLENSLTKRSIGLYILKLLQRKARYGYEIKQAIMEEFSVNTSQISTYKALYKLNEEGLVRTRIHEPIGSRTRKYYFITPMGMKLLIEARKFLQQTYDALFGRNNDKNEI